MSDKTNTNLWGGRFTGETDPAFAEFNSSFGFDRRLFAVDVQASMAHCNGLKTAGVLTNSESDRIKSALQTILEHGQASSGYFDEQPAEDVHTFVEARLVEMIGDLGRKLHTGRSRNDQVATDLRLWLRGEIDGISTLLVGLQKALLELADKHADTVMPGFTHLQVAQPVTFGHHMLAYVEMFARDAQRMAEVR